jgi:hypothetical protein
MNDGYATHYDTDSVAVVIPVYMPVIDGLDLFSLHYSLNKLKAKRDIYFVCPESLETAFYSNLFPRAKFVTFDDCYFKPVENYNQLLLNPFFYEKFDACEFILLYQTDAIILRDELDYWCNQEYDYIGAPWPMANKFVVNTDRFKGQNRRVRCYVGNGGLSLRRVNKCVELFDEFPEASGNLAKYGIHEDLFFSMYGLLSDNFSIPDKITASKFSLEISASFFFDLNGGHIPMGAHAWWKYDPDFFLNLLGSAADTIRETAFSEHFNLMAKFHSMGY